MIGQPGCSVSRTWGGGGVNEVEAIPPPPPCVYLRQPERTAARSARALSPARGRLVQPLPALWKAALCTGRWRLTLPGPGPSVADP